MLTAEHEEAEVLRYARLKAHAPNRPHGFSLRWLLHCSLPAKSDISRLQFAMSALCQ